MSDERTVGLGADDGVVASLAVGLGGFEGVCFAAVGEGLEVDPGEVGGSSFVLGQPFAVFGVVGPAAVRCRG